MTTTRAQIRGPQPGHTRQSNARNPRATDRSLRNCPQNANETLSRGIDFHRSSQAAARTAPDATSAFELVSDGACKGGPRAANHADLSDCCLSIAEQQLGVVGLPAHALVVHSGSEAPHDRLAGGAGGFVIPLARGLSLRRARLGHGHHILPAGPDRPKRSSVHDPGAFQWSRRA